jgi:pullulanase
MFKRSHFFILVIFICMLGITSCNSKTEPVYNSFEEYPEYKADNLWTEYSPRKTTFRIWAPEAEAVKVNIYERGHGDNLLETHALKPSKKGSWMLSLRGDYNGKYYAFQTRYNNEFLKETPGIYAIATGVNGKRAMILDLAATNPDGWDNDVKPELVSMNDIILYELHVRDITLNKNSGSNFPGKYLGLVEEGTTNTTGQSTGIDHIKELGVTHVHLLPVFDYRSVDETRLHEAQFNWGYDPVNYNVPEGSYASDPYNAEVRIKEFKQMVKGFHDNGIRVIMDVVYNHTSLTEDSNFNLEVPGYYYRTHEDGTFSDASACGNETASERTMMRKYIIESCKYWAKEYHIDGFRFDLMAIHDIETMNLLSSELKKIDPTIFVYGEGWAASSSLLADSLRALKVNTHKLTHIAAFSDDIRDGIKGNVFDIESRGFVTGASEGFENVKFGVVGSILHEQVDYSKTSSKEPWANRPSQTISYVSCHDNNTLFDKLTLSLPDLPIEEVKKLHMLSNAIVLTSQGIPFLHAGVELLRTKGGEHNSYNKPDEVNQIDWNRKMEHYDVFDYYRELVELRKAHPAFRMSTAEQIQKHLEFFEIDTTSVLAFQIKNNANDDSWKNIIVAYSAMQDEYSFSLPDGKWNVAVKGPQINRDGMLEVKDFVLIPGRSMMLLFQ